MLRRYAKPATFLLVLVALFLLDRYHGWSRSFLSLDTLEGLRAAVQRDPWRAAQVYVIATALVSVLLPLSGMAFARAAGVLFGPNLGILLCLLATTIGAVLAFWVGRYFLQGDLKPLLEGNQHLNRFLFEEIDRSGFVLLLITRLLPFFPFSLQNFAYGITDIGFWPYTLYTFLFMAPGVSFFAFRADGMVDPSNPRLYLSLSLLLAVGIAGAAFHLHRRYVKGGGDTGGSFLRALALQHVAHLRQSLAFPRFFCRPSDDGPGQERRASPRLHLKGREGSELIFGQEGNTIKKIGFIGLGKMGAPMAKNLLKAGRSVVAFNRFRAPLDAMVTAGAEAGESPRDVAARCDVVVTMLPNSSDVRTVLCGPDGILEGLSPGKVVVDMSSIAPLVARELCALVEGKGAEMLDAPVSGGVERAEKGELTIMVGGKEAVYESVRDLLDLMGTSRRVGESGADLTPPCP